MNVWDCDDGTAPDDCLMSAAYWDEYTDSVGLWGAYGTGRFDVCAGSEMDEWGYDD